MEMLQEFVCLVPSKTDWTWCEAYVGSIYTLTRCLRLRRSSCVFHNSTTKRLPYFVIASTCAKSERHTDTSLLNAMENTFESTSRTAGEIKPFVTLR